MLFNRFVLGALLLGAVPASFANAQPNPSDLAEVQSRYLVAVSVLQPIIASKVFPAYNDLNSGQVPPINTSDIEALLRVVGEADFIHSQLSPEEATYRAAPDSTNNGSDWQSRRVCHWVSYHDEFGRCFGRWEWIDEWYRPVRPQQQQQYEVAARRRPLRENIQALGEYFQGRSEGSINANYARDRAAALQLMSVLYNLDPNFDAGQLNQ